jgi:hypothetical protein
MAAKQRPPLPTSRAGATSPHLPEGKTTSSGGAVAGVLLVVPREHGPDGSARADGGSVGGTGIERRGARMMTVVLIWVRWQ